MITGDLKELNQVKSVVASSMAIIETFKQELKIHADSTGSQTDTEKELLESLESLYESGEDVLWSVDMAISDLMRPKPDDLPWEEEQAQ